MIVWKEKLPDFRRRPIGELLPSLPFLTACAVTLTAGELPLVVTPFRVMDSILKHLKEKRVEMGGLLVGRVYVATGLGSGCAVSIEEHVRCEVFEGTSVSLRMDSDVWEAARGKAGGDCSVVGWYHSHPDLGAFFSGTDRRTQAAFFNHAHCLGLVIDPVRLEERWFIGADSEPLAQWQIMRFPE
jgi:proteasome lid subunit RPN8/RPN11